MSKIFLVAIIAFFVTLQQCDATIKCHFCLEPCEVSKAKEKVCGQSIGEKQEAVCTTEIAKDSKTPDLAIRKCQIVNTGAAPVCPANSDCTFCKQDLCNSAITTAPNMAALGIITTFFVVKFLLN